MPPVAAIVPVPPMVPALLVAKARAPLPTFTAPDTVRLPPPAFTLNELMEVAAVPIVKVWFSALAETVLPDCDKVTADPP